MAVALVGTPGEVKGSTASTTLNFAAPSTVTAGHLWLCTAFFLGGSGPTISGVPGSFTLIQRVNNGTAVTLVVYWYVATGSETAGANFASITISASSRHFTMVSAFSGAATTSPTGTPATGATSASPVSTGTLESIPAGDTAYAVAGFQNNGAPTLGSPLTTDLADGTGAGTAKVDLAVGHADGAQSSQAWSASDVAAANAILAVRVIAAATGTQVTLAEAGAAADAVSVAASVPLAETAGGAGTLTLVAASPLAEAGTGTETLGLTLALTDAGGGTEALAVSLALGDTGLGADAVSVEQGAVTKALTETGTGADALSLAAMLAVAEAGAGSDQTALAATATLGEAGVGAETALITAPIGLPEAGTGTETATISVALAEVGVGADALVLTGPEGAPDAILAATSNLTGPVTLLWDDPTDPDSAFLTATDPAQTTRLRVSFPTPTTAPASGGPTQFQVWLRRTASGDDPTAYLSLYEAGTFKANLGSVVVTSQTGQLATATIDPGDLTDPSGADAELDVRMVP